MRKIYLLLVAVLAVVMLGACKDNVAEISLFNEVFAEVSVPGKTDKPIRLANSSRVVQRATFDWTSDNEAVCTKEGYVVRQEDDIVVLLTLTVTIDDEQESRNYQMTVLKKEKVEPVIEYEEELAHHFDFKTLTEVTSYVTVETETIALDLVTNQEMTFTRYAIQISGIANQPAYFGLVASLRSKNNWMSPYFYSEFSVTQLSRIIASFSVWNTDASYNLSFLDSLVVQVSTDKATWTTIKDITSMITTTVGGQYVADITVETPGDYYVRILMTPKDNLTSTYQFRLIFTELELYSMVEI